MNKKKLNVALLKTSPTTTSNIIGQCISASVHQCISAKSRSRPHEMSIVCLGIYFRKKVEWFQEAITSWPED